MEAITREEKFMAKILGEDVGELKPITRVEKFLAKIAENGTGGGGFGPTVTYGDTLTWDGNTEGHLAVGDMLYKVSEMTPSYDDFVNGYTMGYIANGEQGESSVTQEEIIKVENGLSLSEAIFIAYENNVNMSDFVFPERGTYFAKIEGMLTTTSLTIPGYAGFETTTYPKIPIESLPEGYPYVGEGVIFEEATVECHEAAISEVLPIAVGATYKVKWNGTEYTCVAKEFDATAMGVGIVPYIGNGVSMGLEDTGEPFVIAPFAVGGVTMVVATDGSTSATVGIKGEVVHKMDEKYLPEIATIYTFKGIVTVDDVNGWDANSISTVSCPDLLDTVYPLVMGGKTLFFLEIAADGGTIRFPCDHYSGGTINGFKAMTFRFTVEVVNGEEKKVNIQIDNISGD